MSSRTGIFTLKKKRKKKKILLWYFSNRKSRSIGPTGDNKKIYLNPLALERIFFYRRQIIFRQLCVATVFF